MSKHGIDSPKFSNNGNGPNEVEVIYEDDYEGTWEDEGGSSRTDLLEDDTPLYCKEDGIRCDDEGDCPYCGKAC